MFITTSLTATASSPCETVAAAFTVQSPRSLRTMSPIAQSPSPVSVSPQPENPFLGPLDKRVSDLPNTAQTFL